jgi:hypothetical protein
MLIMLINAYGYFSRFIASSTKARTAGDIRAIARAANEIGKKAT